MSLYEHGFEGNSDQDFDGDEELFSDNHKNYVDDTGNIHYNGNGDLGNSDTNEAKKKKFFNTDLKKVVVFAIIFGIVAGVTFQGVNSFFGDFGSKKLSKVATTYVSKGTVKNTSTGRSNVKDASDIVSNVMPAIVQVTNMSVTEYRSFFGSFEKPSKSAGSGIIVSQDEKYIYIATNNHVVANSKTLTVTFSDDKVIGAEVVGTNEQNDIAVIKAKVSSIPKETLQKIKVATLGNSDNLSVGESAVVIGNALGYGQSVTTGVISALNRNVALKSESGNVYNSKLIQTDAAVNPGNSGGALLNMNGEVIGVVSAKYSDTNVEGMGYAIPINNASKIIKRLIKGEPIDENNDSSSNKTGTGYLGIYGFDVSPENAMAYDMPEGVYVSEAIKNLPAYKAGISKGDIITAINSERISGMEELKSIISTKKAGEKIHLKVALRVKDYKEKTFEVVLTDFSNAPKKADENNKPKVNGNLKSIEDYIKKFFNGGN